MSVRKTALDPSAADLARRRLGLLGADLAPPVEARPADAVLAAAVTRPRDGGAVRPRPGRHVRPRVSLAGRVLGRAGDVLPPTLHGRLRVTSQHVTVVALLLAAAMTLAAWLVVHAQPEPLPARASLRLPARVLPVPAAGGAAGVPGALGVAPGAAASGLQASGPGGLAATVPAAPTPAAVPAAELVVHVAGRVRRPGVVELPAGSRVVDAIEAAGGARPGTPLGTLNLARLVVDGEQIAVGRSAVAAAPPAVFGVTGSPTPAVPGTTGAPTMPVDLNTATQAELEELPGVGPVTATSIIEWRTEHGGFSTVDELIEVSGIGEVTLAELRDLVTV